MIRTYGLIALGGAIGSVGRAWLGTALVGLTGASFPWGTILINTVGSSVIGFFGTLTAASGRFALPFDARAFVMVGICGGFTTFSSFSLQTLELMRDGRAAQALGNVLLSVALCLAGVAAGHSLALGIRTSRLAAIADAAPGTLGTSMLVALHRPEAVDGLLAAARRMIAQDDGQILALTVDGGTLAALQPTEEVMTRDRAADDAAKRADWVAAMRTRLDRWVQQERAAGHPARWIEVHGDGARALAEHGRNAHLLLLEQRPADPSAQARAHAALRPARRPVLLVPAARSADIGHTVAIAWHRDGSVRGAVQAAYPLLCGADRIIVLTIGDTPPDPQLLAAVLQGLEFEVVSEPAQDHDVGAQLLAMAHAQRADLLVMGSTSRGRVRDRLFDGVTESILMKADLPVLIQHQDALG